MTTLAELLQQAKDQYATTTAPYLRDESGALTTRMRDQNGDVINVDPNAMPSSDNSALLAQHGIVNLGNQASVRDLGLGYAQTTGMSPQAAATYLYGPGAMQQGPDGNIYYQTTSGAPLDWNALAKTSPRTPVDRLPSGIGPDLRGLMSDGAMYPLLLASGVAGLQGLGVLGAGEGAAGADLVGGAGADTLSAGSIGGDTTLAANTTGGMSIPGGVDPFTGAVSGPMSSTGALSGLPDASAFLGGAAGAGTGLTLSDLSKVPTGVPGGGSGSPPPPYDPNSPITEGNAPPGPGDGSAPNPNNPTGTTTPGTTNLSTAGTLAKYLNDTFGTNLTEGDLKIGGTLASTALGMFNSNSQSNALQNIANQQQAYREPYRQASLGYLNDPNSFFQGPVAQGGLDAITRKLSVGGNVSDPAKIGIANTSLNQNYWNTVNSLGSLGLSGNIPQLQTQAVQAQGGGLTNLAGGISALVNPPQQSLTDFLKAYGIGNPSLNTGSVPT